jgi:class 3 adenylate cyclase
MARLKSKKRARLPDRAFAYIDSRGRRRLPIHDRAHVLLRKLGDRYGALLNDVRGILRAAVSGAGGREIDSRADEFFAVFPLAGIAVEAAVAVQRDLAARKWTDGLEVRLRIGIHSGHPTLTEAGYIGLAAHTAARVCAAAHGRQIIVSAATRTAIGTSPPAGVRFRGLGRHRLSGLPDPEMR